MNYQPILPNLSGQFPPIDQQLQTFIHEPYDTSHPINRPCLYNDVPTQLASDQPRALHLHNTSQEPLTLIPQGAASLGDAGPTTTPMSPTANRRKMKAPTLRAEDWEPYKARIIELHDEQRLPLPRVKLMIEEEFDFTAELRQYRTRITQWGKDKNVKPREMTAIVRKRQQRKLVDTNKREQTFTVRGRIVEPNKIDRWMGRNKISQTSLYAHDPVPATPSAVGCRTISDCNSVVSSSAYSMPSLNFAPMDITPIVSSPIAPSTISFLREITHAHSTNFTGQSPAPVNQPQATCPSPSYSNGSDSGSDRQLPRRYRQDDEEHVIEELSMAEDSFGINDSRTLKLRIELGYILISQGRYKSAEETARRAIEDCQRQKSNSAIIIDATELLVHVLCYQGSSHQATKLAESLIKSKKATFGREHLSTLMSMEALSWQYVNTGKFNYAEKLCKRTIKISKKTLGKRHSHTVECVMTLSFIHLKRGQLSDAERLSLQVLQIRTKWLGTKHRSTIKAMSRVADVYCFQTRWKDAAELLVLMVEHSKLLVGEEHRDTLTYRRKLAEICRKQGQLKDAEDLVEQVLVVMKKVYGEQHPQTLESMSLMVETYMGQRRFKEAEDLGAPTLAAMKEVLGNDHRHTLRVAELMGEIRKAQVELSEAEGYEEQKLDLEMDWRIP